MGEVEEPLTVDQLIEYAEGRARTGGSIDGDHELSIEESLTAIAYALVAIAKMMRAGADGDAGSFS